jgi:hypothetical protein
MSLYLRLDGWVLQCNRCMRVIRSGIQIMTDDAVAKNKVKRHFCARCILKRRDPEDYNRTYGPMLAMEEEWIEKLKPGRYDIEDI